MTNEKRMKLIMIVLRNSAYILVFTFFFAIIAGPNICHYINLCVLAITITVAAFLLTEKNTFQRYAWQFIILNIALSIGLLIINYGYF